MTHDEYCYKICKAKCCTVGTWKCPNLGKDFKCKIYDQWTDNWCHYKPKAKGIAIMPIQRALRFIDPKIKAQCCYAHPELLEKSYGD